MKVSELRTALDELPDESNVLLRVEGRDDVYTNPLGKIHVRERNSGRIVVVLTDGCS